MLEIIAIIVLALTLCIVSAAAVGAVIWLRRREQQRDQVLEAADALAQLDDALDTALMELNKVGNLVQKEITEKYQAVLFMYNLLEEKQRGAGEAVAETAVPAVAQVDVPAIDAPLVGVPADDMSIAESPASRMRKEKPVVETVEPAAPETVEAEQDEIVTEAAIAEAVAVVLEAIKAVTPEALPEVLPVAVVETAPPAPPAPVPRRRAINPKHEKVCELHKQGVPIADIAKELGIGKGEAMLILEMAERK